MRIVWTSGVLKTFLSGDDVTRWFKLSNTTLGVRAVASTPNIEKWFEG